jgi:tripartite-type tricarboxylate transporter receptor subunit TctC
MLSKCLFMLNQFARRAALMILIAIGTALMPPEPFAAGADAYRSRPICIFVPKEAGSSIDIVARLSQPNLDRFIK